jgi:hypothetical protein
MRRIVAALILALALLIPGFALAHGGHGHVMGTVSTIAADHLEIKTKDGKIVSVPLNSETKFFKGKEKAARADLQVGDRVVAHLDAKGIAGEIRFTSQAATNAEAQGSHTTASLTRVMGLTRFA